MAHVGEHDMREVLQLTRTPPEWYHRAIESLAPEDYHDERRRKVYAKLHAEVSQEAETDVLDIILIYSLPILEWRDHLIEWWEKKRIERLKDYLAERKRLEKRLEALRRELMELQSHPLIWQGLVPNSVLSQGQVVFYSPDNVYCAEHEQRRNSCACRDREPNGFDREFDRALMAHLANPPRRPRRKGRPCDRALDSLTQCLVRRLAAEHWKPKDIFPFLHDILFYCFGIEDQLAQGLQKRWERNRQHVKKYPRKLPARLTR
jgi:hypothetical protein